MTFDRELNNICLNFIMYKVIVRFKSPFNGVTRNLSVFNSLFSNTASSTPPPTQEEVESQEPNELQVKIDGLTKKVEEIDDKYKRALAETENMRYLELDDFIFLLTMLVILY